MKALLELCAYDCRVGNTMDHYYRVFEDRRALLSEATLGSLREVTA